MSELDQYSRRVRGFITNASDALKRYNSFQYFTDYERIFEAIEEAEAARKVDNPNAAEVTIKTLFPDDKRSAEDIAWSMEKELHDPVAGRQLEHARRQLEHFYTALERGDFLDAGFRMRWVTNRINAAENSRAKYHPNDPPITLKALFPNDLRSEGDIFKDLFDQVANKGKKASPTDWFNEFAEGFYGICWNVRSEDEMWQRLRAEVVSAQVVNRGGNVSSTDESGGNTWQDRLTQKADGTRSASSTEALHKFADALSGVDFSVKKTTRSTYEITLNATESHKSVDDLKERADHLATMLMDISGISKENFLVHGRTITIASPTFVLEEFLVKLATAQSRGCSPALN